LSRRLDFSEGGFGNPLNALANTTADIVEFGASVSTLIGGLF
jgi:hypothetical protein